MIAKDALLKKTMESMYNIGSQLTSKTYAQLAIQLILKSSSTKYAFAKQITFVNSIVVDPAINNVPDRILVEFMNELTSKLGLTFYKNKAFSVLSPEELSYLQNAGLEI